MTQKISNDCWAVVFSFCPIDVSDLAQVNRDLRQAVAEVGWETLQKYRIPGLSKDNFMPALSAMKWCWASRFFDNDDFFVCLIGTKVTKIQASKQSGFPFLYAKKLKTLNFFYAKQLAFRIQNRLREDELRIGLITKKRLKSSKFADVKRSLNINRRYNFTIEGVITPLV